jgi:hypothetical protein
MEVTFFRRIDNLVWNFYIVVDLGNAITKLIYIASVNITLI